ncbi:MAG: site-2 protease family protein [Candidatus Woesebacteria bacterium]
MLFSLLFSNPLEFLLVAGALIVSLTIHEFSHALVAEKLGDPTPRLQGRISLNPLVHLDPLGTVAMLLVGFGWGKPVMFDPYNLRNPKRDAALIAAAGPVSNILLATTLSILLHLISMPLFIQEVLGFVIATNVGLAVFNLIPIHPLDGGKILIGLAPREVAAEWDQILRQYGTVILLFLILPLNNGTSAVSSLISPIVSAILRFLL